MREELSCASFGASAEAHGGEATTPRTSTKYTAAFTQLRGPHHPAGRLLARVVGETLRQEQHGLAPAAAAEPLDGRLDRGERRPALEPVLRVQGLGVRPHDRRAAAWTLVAALLQPVAPFDQLTYPGVVVLDDAQRLVLGHELRPDVPGPAPEPRHEGPEILPVLHQGARPARAGAGGEDSTRSPSRRDSSRKRSIADRASTAPLAERWMSSATTRKLAPSGGGARFVATRAGGGGVEGVSTADVPGAPGWAMPSKATISWARLLRGPRSPRGSSPGRAAPRSRRPRHRPSSTPRGSRTRAAGPVPSSRGSATRRGPLRPGADAEARGTIVFRLDAASGTEASSLALRG